MKMLECLESDKESFITSLSKAGTADKARDVLGKEVERLLYRYTTSDESDEARSAAAYMLQTTQMAAGLIDTTGELKVWEAKAGGNSGEGKMSGRSKLMLAGGGVCLAVSLISAAARSTGIFGILGLPVTVITLAVSYILIYLAGVYKNNTGKTGNNKSSAYHVEAMVDADRVYRCLHTVVLAIDQNIDEINNNLKWEQTHLDNEEQDPISEEEISLFSSLLEASYSGDGQFALDQMGKVKYFLYKNGIEIIEYSEEKKSYFDIMPSMTNCTMRPALVKNGRLIKRGLATGGM